MSAEPSMSKMKMRLFLEALECSSVVRVVFRSRFSGLVLPPKLQDNEIVTLDYGLNLPIQIADLAIDERGISATLSFNGAPHLTLVLWGAVLTIMTEDVCASWRTDDVPAGPAELPPAAGGRRLRAV
jgi:hypothetical protein